MWLLSLLLLPEDIGVTCLKARELTSIATESSAVLVYRPSHGLGRQFSQERTFLETWRPKVNAQNPCKKKMSSIVMHVCNPCAGEAGERGTQGFPGHHDSLSKKQDRQYLRNDSRGWPSVSICEGTCTHSQLRANRQKALAGWKVCTDSLKFRCQLCS